MFGVEFLADDVERLELSAKSGEIQPDTASVMPALIQRSRQILSEMTSYLQSSPGNGSID